MREPSDEILLVDDVEGNLLALEALLRGEGVTTVRARSGEEALEQLLVHDVALALIDVQMPGMDGFALAELMRGTTRTREVPIIFVTAGAHDLARVFQGYDAGAVDFLHKPIDPRILRNKVATFVALHRQSRELGAQVELLARREREAAQLRDELAQTLQLQEMFVAAISHDLRSPLTAIMMGLGHLERAELAPRLGDTVRRVGVSCQRMARMLDELGDLARARIGGGLSLRREPDVELLPIVESAVVEARALRPGVGFKVVSAEGARGAWDRSALEKIVVNLVSNAVRHGRADEPIEVTLAGDGPDVRLAVRNGGDVRQDVRAALFEPFRRSTERSASREGLGLGLYIVHQLARAHGGDVTVETGGGTTTFALTLPRDA